MAFNLLLVDAWDHQANEARQRGCCIGEYPDLKSAMAAWRYYHQAMDSEDVLVLTGHEHLPLKISKKAEVEA